MPRVKKSQADRLLKCWMSPGQDGFHPLADALIACGAQGVFDEVAERAAELRSDGRTAFLRDLMTLAQVEYGADVDASPGTMYGIDLFAVAVAVRADGGITPRMVADSLCDASFFSPGVEVRVAEGWYRLEDVGAMTACQARAVLKALAGGEPPDTPASRPCPASVGYSVVLGVALTEVDETDTAASDDAISVLTDSDPGMEAEIESWRDSLVDAGMVHDAIRPCVPSLLAGELGLQAMVRTERAGRKAVMEELSTVH